MRFRVPSILWVVLLLILLALLVPVEPLATGSVAAMNTELDCGRVLLAEVYPVELAGDEFVTIWNPSSCPVDLSNWSLTDGEGTATLPPGSSLGSQATLTVARSGALYHQAYLRWPAFELLSSSSEVPEPALRGTLRLANVGDELSLRRGDGTLEDRLQFGESSEASEGWVGEAVPAPHPGRILRRIGFTDEAIDSNSIHDWVPLRLYRLGQEDLRLPALQDPGPVRPLLAPDTLGPAVREVLSNAQHRILIAAYEFSSRPLAQALLDRLDADVEVTLFLEGQPVGGLGGEAQELLGTLAAAGATVVLQTSNASAKIIDRFAAMHAKYLVVDGRWAGVFTENFSPTGMSQNPTNGNRGWGVIVDDAMLAGELGSLFSIDANPLRMDVSSLVPTRGGLGPVSEELNGSYRSPFPLWPESGVASARLILGPDQVLGPDGLAGLLRQAESSIEIELLRSEASWEAWWGETVLNPLLGELREAARRGVRVRLLLDPEDSSNWKTVELLASWAASEHLPLSAKLLNRSHPFERLHAKGVIVDGRWTALGSQNWGQIALTENREVTLVLDSAELASRFLEAFGFDWAGGGDPPVLDVGPPRLYLGLEPRELRPLGLEDDGGYVALSWDLGGDGTVDHLGASWEWEPPQAGQFTFLLTVRDSWGQESQSVLVVAVLGAGFEGQPGGSGLPRVGAALLPLLLTGAGLLLARRLAARRAPRTP